MSRIYVFVFLNIYGWGKIMGGQFYRNGQLPEDVASQTLGEAGGFEIAWTFMGFSTAYILFVGCSQIVGAWCLLWNRTKLLGAMILFPIMVNILVFNFIFLRGKGPIANASIYTLMLIYIAYHNQAQVVSAFRSLTSLSTEKPVSAFEESHWAVRIALMAAVFVSVFVVDQMLVNLLGYDRG